mmetsp:Transcript_34537/g.102599  ORF Transcript_34537/g.102599 Transcript_34537/m.102599 type:complete len:210 (-) Transcript_34537:92-721(-)
MEVDEHVADGLEVIAPALLDALVGVDGGIPHGAREAQLAAHRRVLDVEVPLAETKVDQVHVVDLLPDAKHEVLGLNVTVDDSFAVQVLDPAQDLLGDENVRRGGETTAGRLQLLIERLAKELHDHTLVPPFLTPEEARREALRLDWLREDLQDLDLMLQLQRAALEVLELHSDLLLGHGVVPAPDFPEAACAKLLVDLILSTTDPGGRP